MRFIKLLILLFIFSKSALVFSKDIIIKEPAQWVEKHKPNTDWENNNNAISGAYYYLLTDYQDNIQKQSQYVHYAIKLFNNEGIQELSDISISYDPKFQKIVFHNVFVYRNGKKINKLNDHEIRNFHVERSGERYLYNGTMEAVINLRDIRENDIIEYSYSIIGYNPVKNGHRSSYVNLQYSVPVLELKNKIIAKNDRPLSFSYVRDPLEANVTKTKYGTEYSWEKQDVNACFYDTNTPSWYDPFQKVYYSDYKNWADVVADFESHYTLSDSDIKALQNEVENITQSNDKIEQTEAIVRFVQDDIRYLGFEDGINAFKPHSPIQVFNQRFGDCKDKSLLLCALLKTIDVNAKPVFVNTKLKSHIKDMLPSDIFNHCVTQISIDEENFYIDPTINYQGGKLSNTVFPNYGAGLIINKEATALQEIPKSTNRGSSVFQEFDIPNENDSIFFTVKTIHYDGNADDIRRFFANTGIDEINKSYVDYYSIVYSGIDLIKNVSYTDNRTENIFTVEEFYKIANFSTVESNKKNIINYNFYPLEIEEYIYVSKSPTNRTMPYKISRNANYSMEVKVNFPQKPSGYFGTKVFNDDLYYYKFTSAIDYKTLTINYEYKPQSDFIPVAAVNNYIETHNEMKNFMSYDASYDLNDNIPFSLHLNALIILLILFSLGAFASQKLYLTYDINSEYAFQKSMPMDFSFIIIGVLINAQCTYYLYQIPKYLNANTWAIANGLENPSSFYFLLSLHMIFEILQICFLVILFMTFIHKRIIFPLLFHAYTRVSVLYLLAFGYLLKSYVPEVSSHIITNNQPIWFIIIVIITSIHLKRSPKTESIFSKSLHK